MERSVENFISEYEKIYQDLFRFALYTLRNREEAEGAVSDTIREAWKGMASQKDETEFRTWIFQILTKKCKQRMKSYVTRMVDYSEDLAWREQDTSEDRDVRAAFYNLSEEDRMLLSLRLFAGYTEKESAEVMNLKEDTIASRQSDALQNMERMLAHPDEQA